MKKEFIEIREKILEAPLAPAKATSETETRKEDIKDRFRFGPMSKCGGTPQLGDLHASSYCPDPAAFMEDHQKFAYYLEYGRDMSVDETKALRVQIMEKMSTRPEMNTLPLSPKRKKRSPFRKASPARPGSIASRCSSPRTMAVKRKVDEQFSDDIASLEDYDFRFINERCDDATPPFVDELSIDAGDSKMQE